MDVRAFGSWISAPKCFVLQDFEGVTEVFTPGRPPDIRVDVPGISGPKTYSLGCFFVPEQSPGDAIFVRNHGSIRLPSGPLGSSRWKHPWVATWLACYRNGKRAQNQKWPRNGRRHGRWPFLRGVPKWPKNGRANSWPAKVSIFLLSWPATRKDQALLNGRQQQKLWNWTTGPSPNNTHTHTTRYREEHDHQCNQKNSTQQLTNIQKCTNQSRDGQHTQDTLKGPRK